MRYMSLAFCLVCSLSIVGCSTESTRGAAGGAATGAVTGAIGGMVTALVFGGDVADAAAYGAVWGGSTGAVAGGISGAQQAEYNEQVQERQRAQNYENLRAKVGNETFRGLEAMAQCRHDVAIAYAESAQQSSNQDFALAGYWLQIIAVGESQGESAALPMLPDLVARDPKLTSDDQARILLTEVVNEVQEVRVNNGLPAKCG